MYRIWHMAMLTCGGWMAVQASGATAQQTPSPSSAAPVAPQKVVVERVIAIPALPLIPAKSAESKELKIEISGTSATGDNVTIIASPATAANVEQEPGEAETPIKAKPISQDSFEASHTEIAPLIPLHDGQRVALQTFLLDKSDNIVAAISTTNDPQGFIQTYSPDLKLVGEFATPFIVTALTIDPSGNLLAAGNGKVAKFSSDGTVLKVGDAPNVSGQDPEAVRKQIVEQYKQSMQEAAKNYQEQIEKLKETIAELEQKKAEKGDEFAKRDENRLKAMNQQLEAYESVVKQFANELPDEQIEAMMQYRSAIPSIAANAQDVYVTTSSGTGYEVWRTDHNFENGARILNGLSGCCGQMDVFATDGQLLVAENTRFQVGMYDRDGKRQAAFGERAQGANNGFGSCCNPMNVVCCSNGDILTAESSIGKIKRFDADGDLIGYVGKARIGGGCKHVALGFDAGRDRYYLQYQDKNQICILVPNAEAETLLAGKRAAQEAGKKIVARIAGDWQLEAPAAPAKEPAQEETEDGDSTPNYGDFVEQMTNFSKLSIALENSRFDATIGDESNNFQGFTGPQALRWTVVDSGADHVNLELEQPDGLVMFGAEIKIVDSDTLTARFSYDAVQQFGKEKTYRRATTPTSTESKE